MKFLFAACAPVDEATLQLLKSVLEEEDIACVVRNEHLLLAGGEVPATGCVPELWIVDDEDYLRAKEIMADCNESGTEPHASWVCPRCKETIEGQFTSCWKCGTELGKA
ncbi:MAG: hypothetical protein A3K19_31905 [Lentisphaerae bacterium RIFOXYB12_FULL_65_16]|nr:MAG: hypothetical protein A3K18_10685 [Lentisphaerae bacterium RIFOXYA12_64_32]OGV88706.1 MAG: hypothetical protein A3K19_31905 [Lentisphaerae bacterium RIFOXYB12_FULL_65_16]